MITLNLVPEDIKSEHARKHVYSVVRNNMLLLFIITTLISIMFLFGRVYLENAFIDVIEDTSQVTGRIESPLTKDIQSSNDTLKSVKNIQTEYRPWHKLLVTLGSYTPDAVVIRQIQVTQDSGAMELLGTASDREAFLEFKSNLESDPLFISVESPISNILNRTNINFTLGITLDPDQLR